MFRTKRSMVGLVLIVILCVFFLGGENEGEKDTVVTTTTTKKDSSTNGPTTTEKTQSKENNNDHPSPTKAVGEEKYDEENEKDYCIWSPGEQDDCKRILTQRLIKKHGANRISRRWLFLGDSTVAQFWRASSLHQIMVDFALSQLDESCSRRYQCHSKSMQQCHLHQQFDLTMTNQPWELPNWELGEGPANVTSSTSSSTTPNADDFCLGCKNCISSFPLCSLIDDSRHCRRTKTLLYGGYVAMPYVRDVLLQTPTYKTTQENILLGYIAKHWNTIDLHDDFDGFPICVVRGGFHDIAIPQMTLTKYKANVQWYLRLLQQQCSHVIWLQNTAPLLHENGNDDTGTSNPPPPKFPQTVERVRSYDFAIYEMISKGTTTTSIASTASDADAATLRFSDFVTTMDVFDASKDWNHNDNIHLDDNWNRALGMFFVKLSTKLLQQQ